MKKIILYSTIAILLISCSPYFFLPQKEKNRLRQDYVSRFETVKIFAENMQVNENDTICDIASGQGISVSILSTFLPKSTIYFVEDINKKVCNRQYYKQTFKFVSSESKLENYRFFIGEKDKLPFLSNSFNHITLFISIHEFEYKEKMLKEIFRILRNTGNLYIMETVSSNNCRVKDKYCGFQYLQDGEFTTLIKKAGFNILKDTIPYKHAFSDSTFVKMLVLKKINKI